LEIEPRHGAKSTRESNIKPVHDVVYELERNILLVSESKKTARDDLNFIADALEYNQLLQYVYGNFYNKTCKWNEFELETLNGIYIYSLGMDAAFRSSKRGAWRPTKVVISDPESKRTVLTQYSMRKTREVIGTEIIPMLDINGIVRALSTIVHVNCWANHARLRNNIENDPPGLFKVIFRQAVKYKNDPNKYIGSLPERFDDPKIYESYWEEHWSLERLNNDWMAAQASGDRLYWLQEYMNIPITEEEKVAPQLRIWDGEFIPGPMVKMTDGNHCFKKFHQLDIEYTKIQKPTGNILTGGVRSIPIFTAIGADLATKEKADSDWTVIEAMAYDEDCNKYLLEMFREKTDNPVRIMTRIYYYAYIYGAYGIVMSDVAFQHSLNQTFELITDSKVAFEDLARKTKIVPEDILQKMLKYRFPMITQVPERKNKFTANADVLRSEFDLGRIHHKPHMKDYEDEMRGYTKNAEHDDIVDTNRVLVQFGNEQFMNFNEEEEIENEYRDPSTLDAKVMGFDELEYYEEYPEEEILV
jgi:phage terminase large subunit-like protein